MILPGRGYKIAVQAAWESTDDFNIGIKLTLDASSNK
tara:strand:+ start:493 stop:603 length:111 start_codon:yes stop_codon:yes gene_type:complete